MVLRDVSPAEQFRNELGQRLAYDAELSLPSANMLVGVIIDAMEYLTSFPTPARTLSPTTLQNVLSISNEIRALARILDLSPQTRFSSLDDIPLATLQSAKLLRIPPSSLTTPNPSTDCLTRSQTRAYTLLTYLSIVRYFITYFGKEAVMCLIKDFNRPSTRGEGEKGEEVVIRKVPGVGPRVLKENGGGVQRRTSTGAKRRSEQGVVRRTSTSRRTRKDKENVPSTPQEDDRAPKLLPGLCVQPQPHSPPPSYDVLSLSIPDSSTPLLRCPKLGSRWSVSETGHSWCEEAAEEPTPVYEKLKMSVRGLGGLGKNLKRRVKVRGE
ncbi:hypothetical protein BDV93DRAFT_522099 [Ceratobasidium sp. AG-I]|nr:hypothetical protein BDV93DRAFT_522099 [Ceratobasidium sp. AG-I]